MSAEYTFATNRSKIENIRVEKIEYKQSNLIKTIAFIILLSFVLMHRHRSAFVTEFSPIFEANFNFYLIFTYIKYA